MDKLKKIIIQTEKNNSFLEQTFKKLKLFIHPTFIQNNTVQACSFTQTPQKLNSNSTAVNQYFKNTIQQNKNQVLQGNTKSTLIKGKKIAVLFSGGPAAGGHNVLVGIKLALGENNTLYGIKNGPKGFLNGELFEITSQKLTHILNLGGFDFLGSDRTKIKTPEQFNKVKKIVLQYQLDGLIIIGGDDSNTNAAILAEYLFDLKCAVIGVPKTIDGDLQVNHLLPITFGFDTATKIYAELTGNILQDTPSSHKYWHFIKVMGRSASHVALEVALQTKPPITLISEEIAQKKMSLNDIITYILKIILKRYFKGLHHGLVLVPEGLIEFIPEFQILIQELNNTLVQQEKELAQINLFSEKKELIISKINEKSAKLFSSLPQNIQEKLLLNRDSHGNLQVSQIDTEQLLIEMLKRKIQSLKNDPQKLLYALNINANQDDIEKIHKFKFATNHHFFGYEGRCGAPSTFDAAYTINLGLTAGSLALESHTGYLASITNLDQNSQIVAIPLYGLITLEKRSGKNEMVIQKALVDLKSPAFEFFSERRSHWAETDCFSSPGPRQYFGPTANQLPFTVALNQGYSNTQFDLGIETDISL